MSSFSSMVGRTLRVACWSVGLLSIAAGCNTTNGFVMNTAGMQHYRQGNYPLAQREFAQATFNRPDQPDYQYNLAMAMKRQGNVGGAEQVLRQNINQHLMHQPSYHGLAQLLLEQNRQDEAQALLQGWADTQPYVAASNVELAWLQRETGQREAAAQTLQQALRTDPQNPYATAMLGQLSEESGQPQQAAQYYQRSLSSRWDQPQVRARLMAMTNSRPVRGGTPVTGPMGLPPGNLAGISNGPSTFNPSMASGQSGMMTYAGPPVPPGWNGGPSQPMAWGTSSPVLAGSTSPGMTPSSLTVPVADPNLSPRPDPVSQGVAAMPASGSDAGGWQTIQASKPATSNADPAHTTASAAAVDAF